MASPFFLRSRRLGFREWRRDDLELAAGLWGDPLVTATIDARGQLSRLQVRERLEQELDHLESCGLQYWPIFSLESGEHVGCCGLRPRDAARGVFELGFHIRSAHWRQGYACEAAEAVIEHAFRELRVEALFAGHNPDNEVSRRLLLALGFRYTHDEYYPPMGSDNPSYLLTSTEFFEAAAGDA